MTRRSGRISRLIERRRKRERAAGIALAVLGVLVLVVAIIALRDPNQGNVHVAAASSTSAHRTGATESGKSTASGKSTTPARSTTPPASKTKTNTGTTNTGSSTTRKLPLVVLNNTTTSGLAQQAADRFTAGGWTVTDVSNYQNDIVSTCAYYDPSVSGAQQAALALQAQYPTIKRVLPQFTGLGSYGSPIVVVLTPDYSPN